MQNCQYDEQSGAFIFLSVCVTQMPPRHHSIRVLNTANGTISSTVPMAGPEYDGRRQSRTTTGYGRTYACVKALVRTTTTTSRWRRRRWRSTEPEEPFSHTRESGRRSGAATAYFIDIRVHICARRRKQFIQIILYSYTLHTNAHTHTKSGAPT